MKNNSAFDRLVEVGIKHGKTKEEARKYAAKKLKINVMNDTQKLRLIRKVLDGGLSERLDAKKWRLQITYKDGSKEIEEEGPADSLMISAYATRAGNRKMAEAEGVKEVALLEGDKKIKSKRF